jgi:hypothetical protein
MATTYKVLGQSAPAATTPANLYTAGSGIQTVVSTLTVTNRGTADATYRISVRPDGDTQADEHYIAYDTESQGNSVTAYTLGLTLDADDVITVYASNADLTFQAFGSEIA